MVCFIPTAPASPWPIAKYFYCSSQVEIKSYWGLSGPVAIVTTLENISPPWIIQNDSN